MGTKYRYTKEEIAAWSWKPDTDGYLPDKIRELFFMAEQMFNDLYMKEETKND